MVLILICLDKQIGSFTKGRMSIMKSVKSCGVVTMYNSHNKFGFLCPEGGGDDIYFRLGAYSHNGNTVPRRLPIKGEQLFCMVEMRERGLRAISWCFAEDKGIYLVCKIKLQDLPRIDANNVRRDDVVVAIFTHRLRPGRKGTSRTEVIQRCLNNKFYRVHYYDHDGGKSLPLYDNLKGLLPLHVVIEGY